MTEDDVRKAAPVLSRLAEVMDLAKRVQTQGAAMRREAVEACEARGRELLDEMALLGAERRPSDAGFVGAHVTTEPPPEPPAFHVGWPRVDSDG